MCHDAQNKQQRSDTNPPGSLVQAVERILSTSTRGWQNLRGGRTNCIWRVTAGERTLAVKLYDPSAATPLFPNDPMAEFDTLQHLQGSGLAPAPVQLVQGEFGTALIYDYVIGTLWSGAMEPLAGTLHRLHNHPHSPGARRVPSGSKALLDQAQMILSNAGSAPETVTGLLSDLADQDDIPEIAQDALIHTDPVATNIIQTANGLSLIDWQCPGLGDPCEDLAIVLSPFMQRSYLGRLLTQSEADAFLAAYPDPSIVDRYLGLRHFFHARMAAYVCWCMASGRDADPGDVAAEVEAARRAMT